MDMLSNIFSLSFDPGTYVLDRFYIWAIIILMMCSLYVVIAKGNLIRKVIGLNLFQVCVFILYISIGKARDGTAAILNDAPVYSNPLPSVLILTAIVVGVSTTAVALSLVARLRQAYGSIEEDAILVADHETEKAQNIFDAGTPTRRGQGKKSK